MFKGIHKKETLIVRPDIPISFILLNEKISCPLPTLIYLLKYSIIILDLYRKIVF